MKYVYDESDGRGTPDQVRQNAGDGVLVYSGPSHPTDDYVAQFRGSDLHHAWIFESSQDRAVTGGYAGGVADCRWHETRIPAGEFTYVVACDLNDGDLSGRDTTPYLKGWAATTREVAFGQYGSWDAITQGMALGGKLQKFWGIVNWLPNSRPNNDQRNIDAWTIKGVDLLQLIGSPIPGTDQDLVLKPGWWSLAAPAAPKGDSMELLWGQNVFGVTLCFLISGSHVWERFSAPANATYGMPQDALDWRSKGGRDAIEWVLVDPDIIAQCETLLVRQNTNGAPGAVPLTSAETEQALKNVMLHGVG